MTLSDLPYGVWRRVQALVCACVAGLVPSIASAAIAAPGDPLSQARRDFDAGRYASAVAVLKAVPAAEHGADALFWLGRAQYELHDFAAAIQSLEGSVALAPDDSESHRWLGRAYGEEAERRRSWSLARKVRHHLEAAVRLSPGSVAARRDLMQFYLDAPQLLGGTDDNAREQLEQICALEAVACHLARAAYARRHHDVMAAWAEYRAVLEARPDTPASYFEVAEFSEHGRNAAWLRAAIDGAAQVDPGDQRLLYFDGVLAVIAGNLSMAESSLNAYLRTPPRSDRPSLSAAHEWLGRLYEQSQRPGQAAAEYRAALTSDPGRKSAIESLKRLGAW